MDYSICSSGIVESLLLYRKADTFGLLRIDGYRRETSDLETFIADSSSNYCGNQSWRITSAIDHGHSSENVARPVSAIAMATASSHTSAMNSAS